MAKKKKQELTSEELLAEALVREEDWPYEVPGNWVWTRLGSVITLISGRDVATNLCNNKQIGIPYILGASNIDDDKFKVERWIEKPMVVSKKNDILISVKGTIGKVYLQKEEEINISRQIMALRAAEVIHNKYLEYSLINQIDFFKESANGLIPGISREIILNNKLPLPPLAEQQRIVNRIESLFDKLDQAKELIQETLDSFETRKAAILHQAFTGELTKKWREEHGVGLESWEEKTLKELCKISSGGTPSRKIPEYYFGKIPWIKTGEIKWNYLEDSEEKISEEAIKNSSAKLFPAGTVLVAMYGQGLTRGRASILNIDATTNQAVCALVPREELNNKFLYYYFMRNYWNFREMAFGGNQPNFSGTMISKFKISLPILKEQHEIVRILDDLFAKEQDAKDLCDQIDQIDTIKKTILGKAFRGELGTNEAGEACAVSLLKEI